VSAQYRVEDVWFDLTTGQKCFKSSVYGGLKQKMKEVAGRECAVCQAMLKIPTDVYSITGVDNEEVDEKPAKVARKKYVRPPGEKPNLSTKMQYLLDQLLSASRRNPNSLNFDPQPPVLPDGDDIVEELDPDGKPYIVKSVVL
jgi:SWI/SNF-related matrix-associated actin-dependent regulator of chromatin subfamily A3